jgi:diguanylate cyclase (GGDEF)-like protein
LSVTKKLKRGNETLSPFEFEQLTAAIQRRRSSEQLKLPVLRVVSGSDMLAFCAIYPGERVLIGRDVACELQLGDVSVSREHAAVTFLPPMSLLVEDLGSTNGTTYQGNPVGGPTSMRIGDEVMIGSVSLRLEFLDLEEIAHLARVLERLHASRKDPLTGLLTRHHLEEQMPEQLKRYSRAHVEISAVFLDVDHFKGVNDTLGHLVGDEVLRTVARLVTMCTRDSDQVIRYGGEEILVVLPNCDEVGAAALAERIRYNIEHHDWAPHLVPTEGAAKPGSPTGITASMGVAEYDGGEMGHWLNRADRALYVAKNQGRNRVVKGSEVL